MVLKHWFLQRVAGQFTRIQIVDASQATQNTQEVGITSIPMIAEATANTGYLFHEVINLYKKPKLALFTRGKQR